MRAFPAGSPAAGKKTMWHQLGACLASVSLKAGATGLLSCAGA